MRLVLAAPSILAAAALCACTTTSAKDPNRVQTTTQAERENLGGAVGAPLRDLNVLRTKIPAALLEAMADPYYRPPGKLSCDDITIMIEPLDASLGPDLDTPKPGEAMRDRGTTTAFGLVAGATSGVIPFRSWVRKLTGAERHDSYVTAAITAGAVRRAYLKGLGESRGCPPPATPSHVRAGTPVIDQSLKPRYPTKPAPEPGTRGETPPADPPR
ncbi:hypothetical protein [Phenylobacterium sp.]|uniref:hypothetical protein n=1 Tax=Phenylobacterium sp. TaxID=1871053 RepID=UPI002DEBA896|nr:hypothetical protein [Phenylobacterium sp.]